MFPYSIVCCCWGFFFCACSSVIREETEAVVRDRDDQLIHGTEQSLSQAPAGVKVTVPNTIITSSTDLQQENDE